MSESENKYNIEYLKYGFTQFLVNPPILMCLICRGICPSASDLPSLQKHLIENHPENQNQRLSHFQELKRKFDYENIVNVLKAEDNESGLSMFLYKLIAKAQRVLNNEEALILPNIEQVIGVIMNQNAISDSSSDEDIPKENPEMVRLVGISLCKYIKTTKFTIQFDKINSIFKRELLVVYVQFIRDEKICQQLLFAKIWSISMSDYKTLFDILKTFLQSNKIPLDNILSVTFNDTPPLMDMFEDFIKLLKEAVPKVIAIPDANTFQCMIRTNLDASLHNLLGDIRNASLYIKENNKLIFDLICMKNKASFNPLWLETFSNGWQHKEICLNSFFKEIDVVVGYLKKQDTANHENFITCRNDVAFITDLFNIINEIHLQLKNENLNLLETKNILLAFRRKLLVFKINLINSECSEYLALSTVSIQQENQEKYCQHLYALADTCTKHFKDILNVNIPSWVWNQSAYARNSLSWEEELIELITNKELKVKFENGYQEFWLQKSIPQLYPNLWHKVRKLLLPFSASLFQRGHDAVKVLEALGKDAEYICKNDDLRVIFSESENVQGEH